MIKTRQCSVCLCKFLCLSLLLLLQFCFFDFGFEADGLSSSGTKSWIGWRLEEKCGSFGGSLEKDLTQKKKSQNNNNNKDAIYTNLILTFKFRKAS